MGFVTHCRRANLSAWSALLAFLNLVHYDLVHYNLVHYNLVGYDLARPHRLPQLPHWLLSLKARILTRVGIMHPHKKSISISYPDWFLYKALGHVSSDKIKPTFKESAFIIWVSATWRYLMTAAIDFAK